MYPAWRELGAAHVVSGFVPPPQVADLLAHWTALALKRIDQGGWSRTAAPESETKPWGWLADYLGDPDSPEWSTRSIARSATARFPTDGLPETAVQP